MAVLEARLASGLGEALVLRADLAVAVCAARVRMMGRSADNAGKDGKTTLRADGSRETHITSMGSLAAFLGSGQKMS